MTTIRLFEPKDGAAFRDLNLAWIEHYFTVEEEDERLLANPQNEILAKGGRVIVAEMDGRVVGCVALVPRVEGPVELAKMAVDPSAQGKGVGHAILERAIEEAKSMGAKTIWIETNSVLKTAIHLYRRAGFKDVAEDQWAPSLYSKCNVQMMLEL